MTEIEISKPPNPIRRKKNFNFHRKPLCPSSTQLLIKFTQMNFLHAGYDGYGKFLRNRFLYSKIKSFYLLTLFRTMHNFWDIKMFEDETTHFVYMYILEMMTLISKKMYAWPKVFFESINISLNQPKLIWVKQKVLFIKEVWFETNFFSFSNFCLKHIFRISAYFLKMGHPI